MNIPPVFESVREARSFGFLPYDTTTRPLIRVRGNVDPTHLALAWCKVLPGERV
jgi:hypothetical protein